MRRGWVSLISSTGKPLCVAEAVVQSFLDRVPLLQPLSDAERGHLAEKLELLELASGDHAVEAGEVSDVAAFALSALSLPFHCLPFHCLCTAFVDFSQPFHRLSLTFHCVSTAFP